VSHTADAVRKNCSRCIWLDHGAMLADGPPAEVLAQYQAASESSMAPAAAAAGARSEH